MNQVKSVYVWDAGVRWFHWINVLCILCLVALGLAILNDEALGISTAGKILLKTLHVWTGYIFALNLLWRLVWAFIGSPYARWRALLPGGKGYLCETYRYMADFKAGKPQQYLGHNPLGRIAVTLLLLLMLSQAITGLVLAGTDLFYPPLGTWIANWVAAPGVDPSTLIPYAKEMVDKTAYAAMRDFRKPFINVHYYGFYALLGLGLLHIIAVVVTEIREGGNLVSAMISGKKIINEKSADEKNKP